MALPRDGPEGFARPTIAFPGSDQVRTRPAAAIDAPLVMVQMAGRIPHTRALPGRTRAHREPPEVAEVGVSAGFLSFSPRAGRRWRA